MELPALVAHSCAISYSSRWGSLTLVGLIRLVYCLSLVPWIITRSLMPGTVVACWHHVEGLRQACNAGEGCERRLVHVTAIEMVDEA
jgi:hypothetical protein